jgi:hypothetical protein
MHRAALDPICLRTLLECRQIRELESTGAVTEKLASGVAGEKTRMGERLAVRRASTGRTDQTSTPPSPSQGIP